MLKNKHESCFYIAVYLHHINMLINYVFFFLFFRNAAPVFANHVDEGTHLLSDSTDSSSSSKRKHTPSLLKVMMKIYAPELLIAHSMRLVADSIQFILPILTK